MAARELEAAIKDGKRDPGEPLLNREKERTARHDCAELPIVKKIRDRKTRNSSPLVRVFRCLAGVLAGSEADDFTGGGFAPLLRVTFALAGLCAGTWPSRVSPFPDPFPDGAP